MSRINKNAGSAEKLVYTVQDAATMLSVSLRNAYNICGNTQSFKVIRLGGKSIRVHKESFDNWFSAL